MRRTTPARSLAVRAAPIAVMALAAVFAFRKLDDFDTWWHLAAGRFIAMHRTIPGTDVLSHTVRDHAWVNLQWVFDVAIYALYAAGGPVLLSIVAACGFTLSSWLLLRLVRPHVGDTTGALLVLAVVLVAQDRFNVRPEMISFPLLLAVLAILEGARRDGGRGAWRLVPVMVLWANVHALFIVGAFAIAVAIAGSFSRRLASWGLAAIGLTIVNPFGWRGAIFPAKLLSRIDRSHPAFQSIAEFRSPFEPAVFGTATAVYKVLLVTGIAVVIAALIVTWSRREREGRRLSDFDLGGVAFFAGLAALSILARRNLALFALGASPLIARSLATLAGRAPAMWRAKLRRVESGAALGLMLGSSILAVLVATGWFYRWDDQTREFGGGVIDGVFPIRAAAFAREAHLPGKIYNDLAAGGYLAWDDPVGDGVFVDGRLEVYDTAFFSDYVGAMYDPAFWDAAALRYDVQTVFLFHHWENRRQLLQRLLATQAWALVYADESAVILVRTRGNESVIARAESLQQVWNARTRAWLERPSPSWRFSAGRVEGTRAFARLLAILGDGDGSIEEYHRLIGLGITRREEAEIRLSIAKYHRQAGRVDQSQDELHRVLAIDPGNVDARSMLTP